MSQHARITPARLCRACCSCNVVQCLCCSLRAGVLFLSLVLLINASLAFAGEALLVFDLSSAVVSNIEGGYLPPGTKLEGTRVHGGLIVAGVYSLLSSLTGFYAVCRSSLRAATSFFILQVVNSFVALTVLAITWMTGAFGFPVVLANVPGIILMVYLCVVTNSYRMSLKRNAAGGAVALPPARPGYREHEEDDEGMGGDAGLDAVAAGAHAAKYRDAVPSFDDELTVTAKDVELGAARPPRAGQGSGVAGRGAAAGAGASGAAVASRGGSLQSVGGGAAAVPSIAEAEEDSELDLDDDDNDLGKPSGQRRV